MKFFVFASLVPFLAAQDPVTDTTETTEIADGRTDIVEVFEPVDCMELSPLDVEATGYSQNYKLYLLPGESCWFDTTATSYVSWAEDWSPGLSVTRSYYAPHEDEVYLDNLERQHECELQYEGLPYTNGEVVYTESSKWPNTDP